MVKERRGDLATELVVASGALDLRHIEAVSRVGVGTCKATRDMLIAWAAQTGFHWRSLKCIVVNGSYRLAKSAPPLPTALTVSKP